MTRLSMPANEQGILNEDRCVGVGLKGLGLSFFLQRSVEGICREESYVELGISRSIGLNGTSTF